MTETRSAWDEYWDGLRESQHVFAAESAEVVRHLRDLRLVNARARVLDFGCGFGHVAHGLAPYVGELWAWDQSPQMREHTARRLADRPNARLAPAEPPDGLAAGTINVVLVHSVAQYLEPEQLARWMGRWAILLAPRGRVIVSDLLPPALPASGEFLELLGFAARRGFLLDAIVGGLSELPRYGRLRRAIALTRHEPARIARDAAAVGLRVEPLPANLGYRRRRMSLQLHRDP